MNPIRILSRAAVCLTVFTVISSCGGGCGGKKEDQREKSSERIDEIRKETGAPLEKIEKLGMDLDALQRACTTKFSAEKSSDARTKKAQECVQSSAAKMVDAAGLKPDHVKDIRAAHIFLQWELKYFLEEKKTDESALKKLFRKGMAAAEQCEKKVSKNAGEDDASLSMRREKCSDAELAAVCKEGGFDVADCGRIVSMGIDYGWEERKVIRVANPGKPPGTAVQ